MDKKVSVIVPIYNGEKYIDRCCKSLLSQTYKNTEFILVDDGSVDNTPQMCDSYAQKDERFVVIHQENRGLSAARNAGTDRATGDYIVYFDVDDEISPLLIEDNIKLALEHDADVVMYCFLYDNLDTGERIENCIDEGFAGDNVQFFNNFLIRTIDHEVFNAPWNKLYKLKFIRDNDLRFLPEYPIYEDIIFAARMLKVAKKIVVNNNCYYTYYVRSSGSLISKYVDGYFDSVTKFYKCAISYCRQYENNKSQLIRFSSLYVKLVTTNLKQISCKKELSIGVKRRKIRSICNNRSLQNAIKLAELGIRKKLIISLIRHRADLLIIIFYKIMKKLDESNWRK